MKILVFVKESDEWSLENVTIDIEQDKKILVDLAKQALMKNGHINIEYVSKSADEYELSVSAKIVNEVNEEVIDFIMDSADFDDYMRCFVLEAKELEG